MLLELWHFTLRTLDGVGILLLCLFERLWVGTKALEIYVPLSLVILSLKRPWIGTKQRTKVLKVHVFEPRCQVILERPWIGIMALKSPC